MKQYAVIIDYSHLFHLSRHAAIAAGPEYDTFRTTIANVEGKLRTVKRELEKLRIVGYDFIFAEDRQPTIKQQLYPPYKNNGRIETVYRMSCRDCRSTCCRLCYLQMERF